ncbi:MAG: hypothetical protein Q4B14_06590, partial [Clostridia bacterium]|nr:hypothetical protein [Clostridia bacterium]
MNKVEKFIAEHWQECIKENREDNGTLLGMPYPYTGCDKGRLETTEKVAFFRLIFTIKLPSSSLKNIFLYF